MATFNAAICYDVDFFGGDTFIIRSIFSQILHCTNRMSGLNFNLDDTISINGGGFSPDWQIEYLGYAGNGWLGIYETGIYFFTNDDYAPDQEVGLIRDPFVTCFLAGTRIATEGGPRPVETLARGNLVLTADGRVAPVRWVGVQTVVSVFADRLRTFPIRVCAGALSEGLPIRNLLVSPDHALMLDGVLVQAGALVNGTTIVRETAMPERFTYYHLELDDHALILAEGVAAETFVDNVARRRFDNYAEFEALHGEPAAMVAEMDAPRVKSARQLPQALRDRLTARATALAATAA